MLSVLKVAFVAILFVVLGQDVDEYALGEKAMANRKYEDAQLHFSRHLAMWPKDARALAMRGRAFAILKNYPNAQADAKAALEIDPNCALAFLCRGTVTFLIGADFEDAMKDFNQAIRLDPTLAPAYNNRGNVRLQLGDIEKAYSDYSAAAKLNPNEASFQYNRGRALMQMKRWDESVHALNEAMRISPEILSDATLRRAEVWSEKGEYEKAIEDYTKVIGLNPQNAKLHTSRALVRLRWVHSIDRTLTSEAWSMVLDDCKQAIDIDPEFNLAYDVRGNAICWWAIRVDDLSKEKNVEFKGLAKYIGLDLELGIKDLNTCLLHNPQDGGAYCSRGTLRTLNGEQIDGLRDLQKAVELIPDYPQAYLQMAKIYDEQKKLYEAIGCFSNVVRLSPGEKSVKRLEELRSEAREKWANPNIKVKSVRFDPTMKKVVTKRSPVINLAPNTQKVVEDTVRVQHSTTTSNSFRLGAEVGGMIEVWGVNLKSAIQGHKEWTSSKTEGSETEVKRSVTVNHSPFGVHIVWVDYYRTGTASVVIDGKTFELPFEFREDFDLVTEPAVTTPTP